MRKSVIVIGGGIVGMLTARELRRAGASVTLVERDETGRSASWAGGGILSPINPWDQPDAFQELLRFSQRQYPLLAKELYNDTGIDPEWFPCGQLVLRCKHSKRALEWSSKHNEPVEFIPEKALARFEPELGLVDADALWFPAVAQIRNPRLLQALKQGILQDGVAIEEKTEVTRIRIEKDCVAGVETNHGRKEAEYVVVAGGAWSGNILRTAGISLKVEPVRGQMVLLRTRPGLISRILMLGERYLIPREDGRVLAGSTLEHTGFDDSTTVEALKELCVMAVRLVPALSTCEVERQWTGLRPGSSTELPYIAGHPSINGLFVNTGHYRNGLTLAPASARLLSSLLLDRKPEFDPTPYVPAGWTS